MKFIYLQITFIFMISQFIYSQENTNCNVKYKTEVTEYTKQDVYTDKFALVNWDFSDVKEAAIKIEIVPILDCFNKEKAIEYKDPFFISIGNTENGVTGSKVLIHTEMMSKCFKWRVIITKTNCEKTSDWQYYYFISVTNYKK
ncbi:hypothetical protein AAIP31_000335 [Flavobacterium psychrophilum]